MTGSSHPALLSRPHYRLSRADAVEQRAAASRLVSRIYSSRGLITNALVEEDADNTHLTVVASRDETVFGAMSVRLDSTRQLLADDLYPDELACLRRQGAQLCEFTRLAVETQRGAREILATMFHLAYMHARLIHRMTDVVIEVNPHHAPFYRRMLGFLQIGERRICPRVAAPALLMRLDLAYADEQIGIHGGQRTTGEKSLYRLFLHPGEQDSLVRQLQSGPGEPVRGTARDRRRD